MLRFGVLLSTVLVIVSIVVSSSSTSATFSAQPIATTRALPGQSEEDLPTPTPGTSDEESEGDQGDQGDETVDGDEPSADRPEGLPRGVVISTVTGHIDGDKFTIDQQDEDGEDRAVLLLGLDAPEIDEGDFGECYATEAVDALEELLPKGETVFLEADQDDTDNRDRLLRYVWFNETVTWRSRTKYC